MHSFVHCSIIHGGQAVETTEVSFVRQLDKKMWYVYKMEHYSDIRKDEIEPFVTTRMALENIMLSEINQTEKVKNHMISYIYGT